MGRQTPASRRGTAASPGERGLQGPEEVGVGLSPQPLQNQPCPQLGMARRLRRLTWGPVSSTCPSF